MIKNLNTDLTDSTDFHGFLFRINLCESVKSVKSVSMCSAFHLFDKKGSLM